MTTVKWADLKVGDALPEHQAGPISRTVLALFAGGSGDHNAIHVDIDFAKQFGFDDVFAHGMLSMAYLAQMLTGWTPQERRRGYSVRFASITPVHAKVVCTGQVARLFEEDGEPRAQLILQASVDGTVTLQGEAVVALT